jgi:hypothetical protein
MITILGCGISGLLAAKACEDSGKDFQIMSTSIVKPRAIGFQYLHDNCGLDIPKHNLTEQIVPFYTSEEIRKYLYSNKVYGNINVPCSMDKVTGEISCKIIYSLDDAISMLWNKYSSKITTAYVNGIEDLQNLSSKCDKLICTVPMNQLVEGLKYMLGWVNYSEINNFGAENYVCYDLNIGSPVYRFGIMFSKLFFESRESLSITGMQQMSIKKVISCCNEDVPKIKNVLFAGRYGRWNKSVLSHNVYYSVKEFVSGS